MRSALGGRRLRRLSALAFTVDDVDDGARLDQWLARTLECSRRQAQRLIDDGAVRVDGARAAKGTRVHAGAAVEVAHAPPRQEELRPVPERDAPLTTLYVDDAVVAIDKPAGIATHPLRAG
ncbi:MAG: hypothetical protein LC659_03875, partial [Myxococcales bacterium]|nr:hypothetical protein [Myxococcales bacterium]